ncbi:LPS export ABC transporter periplasmic protein LptC [Orbus sturtevantii]|uniref:LPS export ABC transporter periplasmic protein LptC n=1 Tax=Orbus sturtevantii TaxID=3074109 RepID=UPI00370DBE6E
MKKKNIIYILLIILVTSAYYYQRDESTSNNIGITDLSTQPIYQSDRMETMVYDPTGKLNYKIVADTVKRFDNTGETLFESPDFTLYNSDANKTWHILAKHATLTKDKLLYLNKQVVLTNLSPDSQLHKIITDSAKIDLTTQIVTSRDKVTIEGANFTSTGIGLLGNLHDKTADILENVKTYYNTPNITDNLTDN